MNHALATVRRDVCRPSARSALKLIRLVDGD